VSKFYPILCPIAQESSLGRKGWILGENRVSRDLLPDIVQSSRTMYVPAGQYMAQSGNVWSSQIMSD
jgi:hypothetical protein